MWLRFLLHFEFDYVYVCALETMMLTIVFVGNHSDNVENEDSQ